MPRTTRSFWPRRRRWTSDRTAPPALTIDRLLADNRHRLTCSPPLAASVSSKARVTTWESCIGLLQLLP